MILFIYIFGHFRANNKFNILIKYLNLRYILFISYFFVMIMFIFPIYVMIMFIFPLIDTHSIDTLKNSFKLKYETNLKFFKVM